MNLKGKNWDISVSWVLTGIWAALPASGVIDVALGGTVGTLSAVVLYVALAVTGVTGQLWFRRYRLQKDLNVILVTYVKELDAHAGD